MNQVDALHFLVNVVINKTLIIRGILVLCLCILLPPKSVSILAGMYLWERDSYITAGSIIVETNSNCQNEFLSIANIIAQLYD